LRLGYGPFCAQLTRGSDAAKFRWQGMTMIEILICALIVPMIVGAVPARSLPVTYALEQVKELDPQGWGPVTREGGRSYRAVLKGRQAWLRVPSWWGESVRPPTGARYILEVTYKDVVDKPVIADLFGAFETNLSRGEVHRFGGANDARWKVAQIPASWDTLIRPKGSKAAELGFRAPGDLPVAQIKVREAQLPQDQARYEAESREWVTRAQAQKAASAVAPSEREVPGLPEPWRLQPMVPYVRPYYKHILPDNAPQQGEAGASIRIRIAQNEYEPGTFAVFAQQNLANVDYSVSELRNSRGERLACEIRRYTAEYALEQMRVPGEQIRRLAWTPQRLWPAFGTAIRQGQSGWFYIIVHTLGKASVPGVYRGRVEVTSGTHSAQIPIEVEVLPITLLTMDEAGLRMGGCARGLPPAGDMAVMREHNHNMINIWFQGVRPEMKKAGDSIEFEFYYLDDWMNLARERGQKSMVWFLGGNPNGYPETLAIEAELYALMYEGGKSAYYEKMSKPENRGRILPEVRPLYSQWLKAVVEHARENNWPELIFTPFDEPAKWAYREPRPETNRKYAIGCGPWIRDHFKAACALIHEAVPQTNVYMSLHNNYETEIDGYKGRVGEIFIPDVDIVCTNAIEEDTGLGDKVRRAGKEFWQYTGTRTPRYSYGFWFGSWDSRGSLCWAYNWGARFDITEGSNWQYAWYSPFETVLTPAYEEVREAWDDRRYLETAKAAAKAAGKDIGPLLERIRADVIDNLGEDNSWKTGRDPAAMDRWRRLLADVIIAPMGIEGKER